VQQQLSESTELGAALYTSFERSGSGKTNKTVQDFSMEQGRNCTAEMRTEGEDVQHRGNSERGLRMQKQGISDSAVLTKTRPAERD
jgi:hypothetical protein